jgi:surface antigen
MTGPHRNPTGLTHLIGLTGLTRHLKNAKAHASTHTTHLRDSLNARTLTRMTGGAAVSAALIAGLATTATLPANTTPHTTTTTTLDHNTPGHNSTGRLLPDNPKIQPPKAPMSKPHRAPAHPHKLVKAADVINLAEQQVGITETNTHGGGTKFQNWYAHSDIAKKTAARDGATPRAYKDAAWCAMFITWLGDNFNFNDQIGGDAYTVTMATWFQNHHRFGHTPKPGAIVFFDWAGGTTINGIDHVGLVTKLNPNGTINTIEGNISDSVVKKTRTLNQITGFGYPNYAT